MKYLQFGRCIVLILLVAGWGIATADEPTKVEDDDVSIKRNRLMKTRMESVKVTSDEKGFPVKFGDKPIFRYTDPARSYVAAAVWKLGDEGRPRAIITTELHRQFYGKPRIVYEYLSLTSTEFRAAGDDIGWNPAESVLQFRPVPDAPTPDQSPRRRLLQLKGIVHRFSGEELVGTEKCELRLMPQPIDRYAPSAVEGADGAIFIAAYGTNPEVLLFLESDGKSWSYAAGRLTGAGRVSLSIDGNPAWEGVPVKYGASSSYNASNAAANIPGVAADGSEVRE